LRVDGIRADFEPIGRSGFLYLLRVNDNGQNKGTSVVRRVAFYISGHGLGHAVRVVEVMNALKEADPSLKFFIRTTAPGWIFDLNLVGEGAVEEINLDVGAVQQTSLWIDKEETRRRWQKTEERWEEILVREMTFIKREKIDLVFGDIPPLAFRIASMVSLPSVAMGNFGWDWIYEPWIEEIPDFRKLVETIREDYSRASLLLRLPANEPMACFRTVEDIPLVARRASKDRTTVRRELGVAEGERVVLLAFPRSDEKFIPWDFLREMEGMIFLSPFPGSRCERVYPFPGERICFPDLVSGSDVVLSKPGYGIVAECYVNQTPVLYVMRDDFRECDLLVQWMRKHMVCEPLQREDFFSGKWEEPVQLLLSKSDNWSSLPTDGARVAANRILQMLGGRG